MIINAIFYLHRLCANFLKCFGWRQHHVYTNELYQLFGIQTAFLSKLRVNAAIIIFHKRLIFPPQPGFLNMLSVSNIFDINLRSHEATHMIIDGPHLHHKTCRLLLFMLKKYNKWLFHISDPRTSTMPAIHIVASPSGDHRIQHEVKFKMTANCCANRDQSYHTTTLLFITPHHTII